MSERLLKIIGGVVIQDKWFPMKGMKYCVFVCVNTGLHYFVFIFTLHNRFQAQIWHLFICLRTVPALCVLSWDVSPLHSLCLLSLFSCIFYFFWVKLCMSLLSVCALCAFGWRIRVQWILQDLLQRGIFTAKHNDCCVCFSFSLATHAGFYCNWWILVKDIQRL